MEIRCRQITVGWTKLFQIYKPKRFKEWEGFKFYYYRDRSRNRTYLVEETTGLSVVNASNEAMTTKAFNELINHKSPEDFKVAIDKAKKAPKVREMYADES